VPAGVVRWMALLADTAGLLPAGLVMRDPIAEIEDAFRTHPALKARLPFLGVNMNATSEKAVRLLGWDPRPAEDAIVASAESLIALGLVDG